MDLNKLPEDLQSQLRSDLVARNMSNCIIELVENALDANASSIAIRINFDTFRVEVVDNGVGLNKEDLKLIGERYFTSKMKNTTEINDASRHFGYRGEGLASIKNVSSRMLIVSRTANENETYCKVIEKSGSEVVPSQYDRKSVGTTVIIENFLEKLPVRQRCIKPTEELQTIKWVLQATALMFPKVNFTLRNDNQKSDIFRIKRTNSTAAIFMELFSGAIKDSDSFLRQKTTLEDITAKIMISKETCSTNQLQFVFVNKRYLPQCNVQKYLNTLLDKVDPSRKISRKAIYILNLSCPHEYYEITFESDRRYIEFTNWTKVEQCLIDLVKLITGDDKFCDVDEKIKKPNKYVPAADAFHEMNTAHTVFGLPANRQKVEKHVEVFEIDDKSNSSDEIEKKNKAKISNSRTTNSRLFKVSKVFRKKPKQTKSPRPRLADQGIAITFKKSPKASKQVEKNKKTRNEAAASRDLSWMWNNPEKEHDSDATEFSDSRKEVNKSSVIPSKNKTNKKVINEKKREQCYKSVVALSNQRALRLPIRERISKKQNYCFDTIGSKRNENYVIEKYGKMNKNVQYDLNEDLNVDDPCAMSATNNAQWTAKISLRDNTAMLPPMTIFSKKPSPELVFEDNPVSDDDKLNQSAQLPNEDDSLMPTLPFNEGVFRNRSPEQEIRRDLCFTDDLTPEKPAAEFLKYDNITQVEEIDPRHKVNEWISKLPPSQTNLNDSAADYITPVRNSYLTDQITSDFKTKTKLSKTPDDSPSLNRTPEKRKSTREYFEPKCKLKIDFSQASDEEYTIKKKPKPKILFKTNCKLFHSTPKDNDIPTKVELNRRTDEIDHTQKLNEMDKENYNYLKEHMSWDELNKNSSNFHEDDDFFQSKATQEAFTQTSDCSGQCRCKCHKKCDSQEHCISQERSTVLNNSTNFRTGPSQADTVILPKECPNPLDYDEHDVLTNINQDYENENMKNTENTVSLSQHFGENSDDAKGSEYFRSKIDLAEKIKFKMNSKFLEYSSAVDIPKGMLECKPKNESRIERLNEDEKKAVVELVKPYKMQDHMTLDDFGNSCLRIFPMLKKQPKKSENLDSDDLNCSVIFSKEDIPSFKFIAQIENKFILASAVVQNIQAPVLILLDQHAVDERIRVERLLREYTDNGEWRSTPINPPIHLNISFNYSSLFTDYRSYLEEFGLHFEFNNRMKNNSTKLIVSFTKVPTCFYNRAQREGNNAQGILKQLIESLTKEILNKFINRGSLVHTVPNELQNVVNYEACRGAVKFGDKLTSQVCSALLEAMAQCKLPFQCAHGRPSVIPLVSFDKLDHLQKDIWKPSLKELRAKLNK